MANYNKGIRFTLKDKDLSEEQSLQLDKIISQFLINNGYKDSEIHHIGTYDRNLQEVWKKCQSIISITALT